MCEFKELVEYAESYNYESFENLFKKLSTSIDPMIILKEINKQVNFIDQRKKKTSILKNDFLIKFEALLRKEGIDSNIVEVIFIIEKIYEDILLKRNEIKGGLSSEHIIAAIITAAYISNYNLKLHLDSILDKVKYVHDKIHLEEGVLGKNIDPDQYNNSVAKILKSNIDIECYSNNWFDKKSDFAILPLEILEIIKKYDASSEKHIDLVDKISINTGLWDIIQEVDFNFRLLKEDIILNENKEMLVTDTKDSIFFKYALISNQRMNRIMLNNSLKILASEKENFEQINVEKLNFLNLLHIDIDNPQEYDGLTIRDWITLFYHLRDIVSETPNMVILNDEELLKILKGTNISDNKCKIFINNLFFKKNTPDIFNTPIIRFEGGYNLLTPFGLSAPNLINIISSILSKKELSLKNKGEFFESNVLNYFKSLESVFKFKCSAPSKKINGEQYQFDIIVEWDDYIFLFECKNRSIPNTMPTSISNFREKIDEYLYQVNRLKCGLVKHSEDFKIDISSKEIIPIILNSLPFSLDFNINDVIFTDFSIISRFFSTRYINKIMKSKNVVGLEKTYDQWGGNYLKLIIF